jgi:hypothetical protein
MSITLEKIDLIRSRANVTYEEAKTALELNNYDEIEALIYLEKNKKTGPQQTEPKSSQVQEGPSVWDQIKTFVAKVHAIRFVVENDTHIILNVPLTILLVSVMILFPFVVTLLILGLIFGYKMTFVKSKTESYEINSMFNDTLGKVNTTQTPPRRGDGEADNSKETKNE